MPQAVQVQLGGQPRALLAAANASSTARADRRLARSVTHSAASDPGPNAGRTSPTQCSSTPVIQSISGTVRTVRRLGGLPLDALPHRTNSPPCRPYCGAFGFMPQVSQV
jgi:hypothetical protein